MIIYAIRANNQLNPRDKLNITNQRVICVSHIKKGHKIKIIVMQMKQTDVQIMTYQIFYFLMIHQWNCRKFTFQLTTIHFYFNNTFNMNKIHWFAIWFFESI